MRDICLFMMAASAAILLAVYIAHKKPPEPPLDIDPPPAVMPPAADDPRPGPTPAPSDKPRRIEVYAADGRAVIIFATDRTGRPVAQVWDGRDYVTIDLTKVAKLANRWGEGGDRAKPD